MRGSIRPLLGVAGFLAVCEIVGRSGSAPQGYLPPPSVVLVELARLLGERTFLLDVIATVLSWLIALAIAAAIAVPAGLLLGSVPFLRNAVGAVVEFLRPIPSVALIPLVVVIAGGGPGTKIFLAVYAAVWPLLFNTIYALGEIDDQLLDSARAFNISRPELLLRVTLPGVAPFVLTGLRLSASTALIVLISTEMLVPASGGIGHFIYLAGSGAGRMDQVLAGTLVAGLLGYAINAGMAGMQRRWVTWAPAGGTT
ncbi:NitT/TauT family transport system permease protein [Halopolyspora algeriensis]|uniref:NitT/TauT family transport system permease protein n=1 Tax=Halopolyspora algeriensis TaxID=1500506 RepID=A0A368VRE4_9ACTN|nr:ABC transporter permease subunit [Halopolyspora algeriensis]RCW43585.1 NitT/TauT family transport system permease protein [Halopolyspora algeriensis]TQM47630.1 NitT/TauT family transport system permease protein [Halopolyspora algeriensis]